MVFFPLLLMKNIYPYYIIFLGKRKYYFNSFISYNRYRLVRIISKVARSLYPGGGTHNVVSLLHRKSHRQRVSSQDSDLVHVSAPPPKNIFELTINYILFYEMIINVIQFCNRNCSVTKVVVPPRKGKQEHIKSTNNI